eukprot:m.792704 g.792704  ORF g.792704 m.792704 type:complete len:413 (-) comp23332_c1_seq31:3065-4303(-)
MADVHSKKIALAVVSWINDIADESRASGDAERGEHLDMAVMYLQSVFNVDAKNEDHRAIYGAFCPLIDHLPSNGDGSTEKNQEPLAVTPEQRALAEQHKTEGNALMTQGDTHGAIAKYTEAIKLCTSVPGFYGNRAAAYASLGDHDRAVADCRSAVKIDRQYAKGYGRLGMSLMALGRVQEAKDAFTQALAIEPNNENFAASAVRATELLAQQANEQTAPPPVYPSTATADAPASGSSNGQSVEGADAPLRSLQSMLMGNPQMAALLGGLQASASSIDTAAVLDSLSSTADAVANNGQVQAFVGSLSNAASNVGAQGQQLARQRGDAPEFNLADMMGGLLSSIGSGSGSNGVGASVGMPGVAGGAVGASALSGLMGLAQTVLEQVNHDGASARAAQSGNDATPTDNSDSTAD